MRKLFISVGAFTIVLGVVAFFTLLYNPIGALCAAVALILSGCLMIAVGDLLRRVNYLERRLNLSATDPDGSDPDLPQQKCPACGKFYDFDYPQCPHCGQKSGVGSN